MGRPVSRTGAIRTVVLRGVGAVVAEPVAQPGPLADLQGAGAARTVVKQVGEAATGAQRLEAEVGGAAAGAARAPVAVAALAGGGAGGVGGVAAGAGDGAAKGVGLAGRNEGLLANP